MTDPDFKPGTFQGAGSLITDKGWRAGPHGTIIVEQKLDRNILADRAAIRVIPTRAHVTVRFDRLDALRGVAALAVLVGHASAIVAGHSWIPRKGLAVQFFFLLSGFVVAHSYEDQLRSGLGFAAFCRRRGTRLYPLIIAGAALGTIVLVASDPGFESRPGAFTALLLATLALPSPPVDFGFGNFPVNPPEWSLFYELLASIAFGVLIRRTTTRGLALATIAAGMPAVAVAIIYAGRTDAPLWTLAFGAAASFAGGVWLHRGVARGTWQRAPVILLAAILLGVCLIPHGLGWGLDLVAGIILFPALIVSAASDIRPHRLARYLGDLSYPLYILHWPVLMAGQRLCRGWASPTATILLLSGAAILVAWAALILYDRPVRALLSQAVTRR